MGVKAPAGLDFRLLGDVGAPRGKIGPVRINFPPNLAQAASAQVVEVGAHRLDLDVQRCKLAALGARLAQQSRQALRFIERGAKLGDPARPGARDNFG